MRRVLNRACIFITACCAVLFALSNAGAAFAADGKATRTNLTLGNARWVTAGASYAIGDTTIGRYMLSWDISSLDVTTTSQCFFTGKVWNADETEQYNAVFWIHNNEVIVDSTSCRAALYVDTSDTSFKIRKSDVFTLVSRSSATQPDELVVEKDYLVSCTLDSSLITVTAYNENNDDTGVDNEPPIIEYDGDLTLTRYEGNCAPQVFAKATDLSGGDVLIKRVWSEGALDENYKLLTGTHTLTLIAKDKAGNSASVVITVQVLKK